MIMNEIWKVILKHPNYEISSLGNIRHIVNKINRKNYDNGNGYLFCKINVGGKYKNCYLHRLVAETFIPNPDNLLEVNHKDNNRKNNKIENLEWCTHQKNVDYANKQGHMGKVNVGKFNELHHNHKEIQQFSKNNIFIKEWKSMMEVERQTGIKSGHISECCNKKRKTAGGYIFKFKE